MLRFQLRPVILLLGVSCALALRGDAPAPSPDLPDSQQVLSFLNQSMDWHRSLGMQEQIANDPGDVLFFNDSRQLSNQALQLSFDFGRAYAAYLAQQKPSSNAAASGTRDASLTKMAADAEQEAKERAEQLESLKKKRDTTRGRARAQVESQVAALESEIALEQARSDTLRSLLQFSGGSAGGGSLLAQVDELQKSVPELESGANQQPPASTRRPQPAGILAIAQDLMSLRRKSKALQSARHDADALSRAAEKLRSPLVAVLTSIAVEGDKAIESSEGGDFGDRKRQLDTLTARFKQLSAVVLPLSKQAILLSSYRSNLDRWGEAVSSETSEELKELALHLGILALALIVVVALAEAWRTAIFHYVHDLRRRYQFLLIRRIVLWIVIAIAVGFALASQIGSLATFVGLITAGMAVALQNVILAVAGYFFLIGKYGVRVGDRVQIGGVTGVVVDIGLIRLHLMEVGSAETGRQPTGRVVVFSNSIVFQAGASFYKQIPGTDFTWHEVTLTLAPETDYHLAEKRMLEAVQSVYGRYRERMETQHRAMQDTLSIEVALPRPHSRLHLTRDGLEVIIRFPTEMENSAEMDDMVTRELLRAIEQSPRLRLVGSGTPNIQPVPESEPPEQKTA